MSREQLVELELVGELKLFLEETELMYKCGISPQLSLPPVQSVMI
jgi:hypothetical protein